MPNIIRETDEYVRYDVSMDDIVDATEQVEAAAEGYTDLDTRLDEMENEIDEKQDTVTAGTGLAFGTDEDANTLGHSNSVTAKATQGFAQIAYDAEGHITGSTAATTAQVNAINSGIDSTKVAQIETNKNNILSIAELSGSYNLLNMSNCNSFTDGLTVTKNVNGSYTFNGTCTASEYLYSNAYNGSRALDAVALDNIKHLPNGTYVIANTFNDSNLVMQVIEYNTITDREVVYNSATSGGTFTITGSKSYNYVRFLFSAAKTYNNLTGTFSLVKQSDWQKLPIVQPYALPNTAITPALQECVDNGAKNLLNVTTVATSNITFTPDNNGYVTASPNNTDTRGWTYASSQYKVNLNPATYVCVLDIKASSSQGGLGVKLINTSDTAIFSSTLPDIQNKTGIVTFTFTIETAGSYGLIIKQYDMVARYMICEKSLYDASPTYQPYAMSNVELTEKKADASAVPVKLDKYVSNASKTYTLANNTPYIITVNSYGTYGMFMAFKYSDESEPRLYEIKKSSSFDSLITVSAVASSSDISIAPVSSSTWFVSSGMKL